MILKDIQILLVSKFPIIRWGLIHVLQEFEQNFIFFEAGTEENAKLHLRQNRIDIMILHTGVDTGTLISLLAYCKKQERNIAVIIIGNHKKPSRIQKLFEKEIKSVISCECELSDIKRAFSCVLNGEVYISHVFINSIFQTLGEEGEVMPHDTLSVRELQVFFLLVKGESLKEIANKMSLSDKTVSSYRSRIMQKFTMKSNAELIRYAYEQQLMN